MSNAKSSSGGVGFLGLLTIVFVTLKLTEVIDWSWWYVLMPSYLPIAIVAAIVVLVGAVSIFRR